MCAMSFQHHHSCCHQQSVRLHHHRSLIHTAAATPQQHQLVCATAAAAGHDNPHHPESAARINALQQALSQHHLDSHPRFKLLLEVPQHQPQQQLVADVLTLVHPPAYLARVQEICASLSAATLIDDSTYIAPGSFTACCETAAAVLGVLDAVLQLPPAPPSRLYRDQQLQQQPQHAMGFCLVRPPGHHVKASKPMGFGLINFMAVAARYALQQPGINKIMILDFDVHHGNGTEDIFYDSQQVLYISSHQQGLWPYTGKVTATGSGPGQGFTINVPLPGDSGHTAMQAVWQQVMEPAARRFGPDLILCSAGYDAHWRDPLAGLQFEERTYNMLCARTAALAAELCGGRCVWLLEGGYDIPSLSASVVASIDGILGGVGGVPATADSEGRLFLRPEPMAKVETVLQQVQRLHGL